MVLKNPQSTQFTQNIYISLVQGRQHIILWETGFVILLHEIEILLNAIFISKRRKEETKKDHAKVAQNHSSSSSDKTLF